MKLVIFDCDGTLVDSQAGIVLSMNHAFATLGLEPPDRNRTLSVVGLSLPEAFAVLAPQAPLATQQALAEHYKNAYRELKQDPSEAELLYPDFKSTVAALAERDDIILGIATGKSRRGVDRIIAAEGWQGLFVTIQTADDHPSKPHPAMLYEAMRETDIRPEDTIMIGDTTYDVLMARAANVRAMGVTWGYHRRDELIEAGANGIIDGFPALPVTLNRMFADTRAAG
jgi:phosphoglycolate phosphatase